MKGVALILGGWRRLLDDLRLLLHDHTLREVAAILLLLVRVHAARGLRVRVIAH